MKVQGLGSSDPRRVGRYRLVGRLGEGGMGVVYAALARDGRRVALKVIRKELRDDPTFRARFGREASIAQRVHARCTAWVLEANLIGAVPFLATEYVEGPTLSEYVGRVGPLSQSDGLALAAGLAEGLAAIHAVGVVHRDVSPRNVILSPTGPKIIDFGIARREDATTLTDARALLGTPSWMAPEQVTGGQVTAATDVFGWGALIAYATTGRAPFDAERPEAIAYRIVHGQPDLNGLPNGLVPAVRGALERDATERPTASSLLRELVHVDNDADAEAAVSSLLDETWHFSTGSSALWPKAPHQRRVAVAVLACVGIGTAAVAAVASTSTHGAPAREVHGGQTIGATATATATSTPKTNTTRAVPVAASTAPSTTVLKVVPSLEEIGFRMGRTVETNDQNTHFSPSSDPVTVSDGAGGWLTAIAGVRFPTADGYGQLVFFWHNTTFVGLDSSTESVQVKSLNAPSAGVFVVTYARYALSDPLCCPSLPPRPIEYRWNGTRLVPSGVPPVEPGTHPVTVTTTP